MKAIVLAARVIVIVILALFVIKFVGAVSASAQHGSPLDGKTKVSPRSTYLIRMADAVPRRLQVQGAVHIDGKKLSMDTTRSDDVPEVGKNGWPALIRDLKIADSAGRLLDAARVGPSGWELAEPSTGQLSLQYEVDYSGLAANNWPAPRETAYADNSHLVFVGRSAFITVSASAPAKVDFTLPAGWHAVTPWQGSAKAGFTVAATRDLVGNLIVLTNSITDEVNVGGFRVLITTMGHWVAARGELLKVLRGVIPVHVRMMGFKQNESYSVVLLPVIGRGGESYWSSFAFNVIDPPTASNRSVWGQTIAHEIFHYWNGWRLMGKDYASSQWFQEGFTDYAADRAMVSSGLITDNEFRERIAAQIGKYRKLATPLANPGNRKGPPLYGGGALVAFCWDIQLRQLTGNKRGIADVMDLLWRNTDSGTREYEWSDIRTALNSTATADWDSFYRKHIGGTEELPLNDVLKLAGLRIVRMPGGDENVEVDPDSTKAAKDLWASILHGRP